MNRANLKNDLESVLSGFNVGEKDSYLKAIKRLDALSEDSSLPKKLQHYLSRRSYHKAKDFLDSSVS